MDISNLHSQLRAKQLNDFYIFTGSEWALQRIYIDQISKISNKPVMYIDKFLDVYNKIKCPGLLTNNFVYVVREDKDILHEEKLQRQLQNGLMGKNVLVLLLINPDKRTKFYKTYKDVITEFEPLKPAVLKKYLQREIDLSDRNLDTLMEVCEYDYGRCLLEIDKIKQFRAGYGKDKEQLMPYDNSLLRLIDDGTIYTPPKDAIFDFVDAVLDGYIDETYDLYYQCLETENPTMVMLSVLYNSAKAVLQVQSYHGDNISKATGLTGWQIKNAKPHCNVYTDEELIDMLRLIHNCVTKIKTGGIDEQFAVEYVLGKVL